MGASRYNNPFDIIPSIVYSIFVQKSCTIVANNRTIFTFFAKQKFRKISVCAYCTPPPLVFVQLAKKPENSIFQAMQSLITLRQKRAPSRKEGALAFNLLCHQM